MSIKRNDPPGFVDDLHESNRQGWSDIISAFMRTQNVSPFITPQFYDQTRVVEKDPTPPVKVTWFGFPRIIRINYPNDQTRWRKVDSDRQYQDESIKRDANGKMLRIVFTNEGPEYFEYLARVQPETLVSLYQKHNPDVGIVQADLFTHNNHGALVYNPNNKWNGSTTTGTIMHLVQRHNTLSAQVDLGARATVIRKRADGTLITDADELIRCSRNGGKDRNSDPLFIGAKINAVARDGLMLTIQNPVGLYIDSINWAQIEPPAGHEDDDPSTFWKWTRGTKGNYMRAEFEVPEGYGYSLGDLHVRGLPLDHGGQLADLISVSMTAHASTLQIQPRFCFEAPPPQQASSIVSQCQCEVMDYEKCVRDFPGIANINCCR